MGPGGSGAPLIDVLAPRWGSKTQNGSCRRVLHPVGWGGRKSTLALDCTCCFGRIGRVLIVFYIRGGLMDNPSPDMQDVFQLYQRKGFIIQCSKGKLCAAHDEGMSPFVIGCAIHERSKNSV